jgi:hypothetical protein
MMGWYNMENPEDTEMKGTLRSIFLIAALGFALLTMSESALSQAIDRLKPQTSSGAISGLYIDPANPARYCVAQTGVFSPWGVQTFFHCAQGWNNAGHAFVTGTPVVGREYLLYRLQADGGYLTPVVINSVTVVSAPQGQITVRFGSVGAQSPAYTFVLQ